MEKYSLFIGRFQPFHEGHEAAIWKLLREGKKVCVCLMDTEIDEKNPYTVAERTKMIRHVFGEKVVISVIPPIDEVCYGRNLGYELRRIRHDKEDVSASVIRNGGDKYGGKVFLQEYRRIASAVHAVAVDRGLWPDGRTISNVIAHAHSELSEAWECTRHGNPPDKNISDMSGLEVQLSDVLGILMDAEVALGLNISGALAKKMKFNETR